MAMHELLVSSEAGMTAKYSKQLCRSVKTYSGKMPKPVQQSINQSIMHACIHSFNHSLSHSFAHAFMQSCIRSIDHSFIHLSMHSCVHSTNMHLPLESGMYSPEQLILRGPALALNVPTMRCLDLS